MAAMTHCITLLHGILLLLTGATGEHNDDHNNHHEVDHEVDTLIQQVGQMDEYFSTDLHRFVGEQDISHIFPGMTFGDWSVNISTDFGSGYRGPVVTDERAKLHGIFQSLNESTLITNALHKDGRGCKISIEGPQLIRNYIRYYRRIKEKMSSDTGMMTLGFEHEGINVTLGIIMSIDWEEEGMLKYLPYKISDLKDLFGFTVPGIEVPKLFTKYEVTVDGNCLPDYEFLNKRNWDNGSIASLEAFLQMKHSCPEMLASRRKPATRKNIPCFDLVKDLDENIDQFFMIAIALQTTLFHMYSEEGFRLSHRVCKVNTIDLGDVNDMGERLYAVDQCCTLQKRHVLPHESAITKKWHCYRPYRLSNILIIISKFFSYVMVALFPLAIKWLPEIHAKEKKMPKTVSTPYSPGTSLLPSDDVKQAALPKEPQLDVPYKTENDKDVNTVWMFLNDDSGYHFSFKVILWHLLLFNKVNRRVVMLRRFLFLYMIALLNYVAALQIHLYYTDLYEKTWQFYFTTFMYHICDLKGIWGEIKKHQFDMLMAFTIFVIPFAMAIIQFLLLSPILFRKESIAQILYWNEKDTTIGKYVGLKVQKKHQDVRHQPYEIKLFFNIAARASYLTCYKFWEYIFTHSIFEKHEGSSPTCLKIIKVVIRVLLLPVIVPLYTFPIFSVFWVIFCGDGGFNFVKKRRCKVFLMRLVVGLGVVYSTALLLACVTMYVHMVMFIMIDVIRTLTDTLTHVIFIISAIVNIKETFATIEDKYREMKLMVFQILEDMSNSSSEEDQNASKNMLKWFDKSTVAIPRSLFIQVCKKHMPYGRLVSTALLMLLLKLAFLGLLYMIIIDFQIFAQLSQTGEGIITIVFVSLPSLLSKTKSDAEKGLEDKYMFLKVKTTIIDVSSAAAVNNSPDYANTEPDL